MKKISIFIFVLFIMVLCTKAYAHPPQDIIITYDAKTRMLHAVIMHNVSNTLNHFIKKVDIGLNGQDIIEHKISRQDNNANQTVAYLIPDAKAGDKLSVEAHCSISGKLKKEITVSK